MVELIWPKPNLVYTWQCSWSFMMYCPVCNLVFGLWLKEGYRDRNVKVSINLTHLWPFMKSKFNLKSDRVNVVAPASPLSVCFMYPMSWRYSTIWDRKGWPGSEIQMYYGWKQRVNIRLSSKVFIKPLHWGNPPMKCKSEKSFFRAK